MQVSSLQDSTSLGLQVALLGGMNNSSPMGIYGFSTATLCAFVEPGSESSTPLRVPVKDACHAQLTLIPVLLTLSRGGHCLMPCCSCVAGAALSLLSKGLRSGICRHFLMPGCSFLFPGAALPLLSKGLGSSFS